MHFLTSRITWEVYHSKFSLMHFHRTVALNTIFCLRSFSWTLILWLSPLIWKCRGFKMLPSSSVAMFHLVGIYMTISFFLSFVLSFFFCFFGRRGGFKSLPSSFGKRSFKFSNFFNLHHGFERQMFFLFLITYHI